MFQDTHGVPGYTVSGTAANERFVLEANEHGARLSVKFAAAELARHVLVKAGAGGVMELVTAATDTVFGVLVEPKPAGATSFYVYTQASINRDLLDLTAMGITDADLDQLQATCPTLVFTRPIFSGAD